MASVTDSDSDYDYYTEDIKTVIYLTPGWYNMCVNSDDGFSVSVGNPAEWRTFRMVLGQYDNGRGASTSFSTFDNGSETVFCFYVRTAGYYPFDLLYFEGGGGNAVTWTTTSPYPFYTQALINDASAQIQTGSTTYANPALVKVYQYPYSTSLGRPTSPARTSQFRGEDNINGYAHPTHTGYDAPI